MKELSKLDREYRDKLKKLNKVYFVAIIFMLICSAILFIGVNWYELKISDRAVSFLMGFFLSIGLVFIIYIIRNRNTMRNPEKLKQQRIIKTDERNLEIWSKALQITSYVMIVALVILSIIGSFVSKSLMLTASGLLYVFSISYLICYFYFRKKL